MSISWASSWAFRFVGRGSLLSPGEEFLPTGVFAYAREYQVPFNPLQAVNKAALRRVAWVSVGGTPLQGAVIPAPGIQQILDGSVAPELSNLPFRNPDQ